MLIGLHGKKQAGKDTTFERVAHLVTHTCVERRAFADKLYASAAAALGVHPDVLRVGKTDPFATIRVAASIPPMVASGEQPVGTVADISVRWYLQLFGTEAHREVFGDNFWVDQVDLDHEGLVVCITDVRFENEAAAIHAAGGVIVQVLGTADVEGNTDIHASEFPLPDHLIDYVIENDRRGDGFAHLDEQVGTVLESAAWGKS